MGIGPPRTDKYRRILSRLFEFLALFHILKRARGPHTGISQHPTSLQDIRRRFLWSLCFLCDYRKGGETTTSMALELLGHGVVFWIAANATPNNDVIAFFSTLLETLRRVPKSTEAERERLRATIASSSIRFSAPRLRKERAMLMRAARSCESYLANNIKTIQTPGVPALLEWLAQFSTTTTDPLDYCQAAYNARHDPQIATLEALKQELRVAPKGTAEPFRSVKHLVGRLSEKIRVPANLVQDSLLLGSLLNSYEIKRIEAPVAAKVPETDGLRNLDSIIRRMLPAGDPRLEDIQTYLGQWDGSMRLEDAIRAMYDDEERNHNVHAEIQVLEEFHRNQRTFVEHDRYIACSKLACLCCKFYFKFHPGRFVEPESHQKTYLNWRPINLPRGGDSEYWPDQRRVLANLSRELSNLVEEQIITRQQPTPWQPDSITNITAGMGSVTFSEVEEVFDSGDGESDAFTDTDSLAHLNDGETVDEIGDGSRDSDEESDGGAALGD
ncbi:hypothetical protein F53441_14236 [Fusarium austroafricanum]|uniref:Uncharacterized protein n=1 Tax=Fusarium austroafricanum TaxID=2364996 RepID=A0A8H4JI97_9HYPO|nr:hypothetical protein F53441_14236 [Fusarium austroafricanum]